MLDECRQDNLRERTTFGLAQTDEAAGDLQKAAESWSSPTLKESKQKADRGYQGVLNFWPDGTYADLARRRLEDLREPSTRAFYDRFAKWEPKQPLAEEPGTPGLRPSTDLILPDEKPLYTPMDPTSPSPGRPGKAGPSGFPQPEPGPAEKPAPEPSPEKRPAEPKP